MKVSVIVPVYNDPDGIRDTLNSLIIQEFPHNEFEIIVSDNGSNKSTIQAINEFTRKHPNLIRLVEEQNIQSSYAARNKGITEAKGEIIAFIDSDMMVEENWIANIMQTMNEKKADYLGCNVKLFLKQSTKWGEYNVLTGFKVQKDISELHFAPTCCLATRKGVFDRVGAFDARLISGGDLEFGNRVHQAGYQLYYAHNIVMKHPARSSLSALLKKSFRIGRGVAQLVRYHPVQYTFLKNNILFPLPFLPLTPSSFQKIFRNDAHNKYSLADKILFYLIKWFTKVSKQAGYIYESLFHRFHSNI